jgi:hypothetical protein
MRTLPGILECGLWRDLDSRAPAPTRALVTDVGNDILYGFSPEQTLEWVSEAVSRLKRYTGDVALTDLPMERIRQISRRAFLFFRTVLVPSSRLSLGQARERTERLDRSLGELAAAESLRLVHLDPAWYGIDPVHFRPSRWGTAWREILGAGAADGAVRSAAEGLRLYAMRPERQWLFGIEQRTPQSGVRLRAGARIWLY